MAFKINPLMIREALAKAANELPPLPSVLVRILQMTESPDASTVNEIEDMLRSDQAISSKLLRVVNSAYFGLSGQVSSVNQAIVILGYQQVRNLVLSVSMMTQFSAPGSKGKEVQQRLWEISFGTATAAQSIARSKKAELKDVELSFVGGLLQNLGCLFMLNTLARSYVAVFEEAENTGTWLNDVENLRLSVGHAELGQELLAKWKLPENLILLVGRHEGPFAGGDPIAPLYAVHAGERIAAAAIKGEPFAIGQIGIEQPVLDWLGFTQESADLLADEIRLKVTQAMDIIGGMTQ